MRKALIIATISFSALFAACGGPNKGYPVQALPATKAQADLTTGLEQGRSIALSYQLGPFNLPKNSKTLDMLARPGHLNFKVEEPMWITSFEPSIEDADGNPLSGDLVHNIILANGAEENRFCTTKQTGNPFAVATSSMQKIDLPEKHGYPVTASDPLEASVVLKNPTDRDYYNVYVKFKITGYPIDGTRSIKDVLPMMIDVDPCDHAPVSVAPGEFVEKTKSVYAPEDGSIVQAYGLLQNYGVSVKMNAKGADPFWEGLASIDDTYKIIDLPPYDDAAGVTVKSGDEIGLTVAYDNVSKSWFDDATAASIVYLAYDAGAKKAPTANAEEKEEVKAGDAETEASAVETQKNLIK